PYSMAGELGMPPWKIRRAQSQARGWSREGLTESMAIVARLNADVKGAAADPAYALERAALEIADARSSRWLLSNPGATAPCNMSRPAAQHERAGSAGQRAPKHELARSADQRAQKHELASSAEAAG